MSQAQAKMQCQAVLQKLIDGDAQAASIVARDGVPVLSQWNISANEDLFAAMAAAMFGAADACAMESGRESPQQVKVRGDGYEFAVHSLDDQHLLVLIGAGAPALVDELRDALQDA
ncbi:MAG: roadblock/LC7 domain-containing protein [Thermoplasmatota archaeon]